MRSFKTPTFIFIVVAALLAAGCVTDPGSAKKRGLVDDFSISKKSAGCGTGYLILSQPDTCTTGCGTGTGLHLASAEELETAKASADETLLARINASAGLCVDDVIVDSRPTNQIDIKSDFCSCINGKSDLISDCAATCAALPSTNSPTLYLNTIMGTEIALNEKLKNLYNWCSVQLESDNGTPQCFLSATDGVTTINNIPVNISPNSNSLTANIQGLALDKTYIVKIIEGKAGSNAQSKEFQLRRKSQPTDDTTPVGALKVTPISQYSCLTYGGTINDSGQLMRTNYSRVYYNFAPNDTPAPIAPAGGTNVSSVVCHDEELHPGNDSVEYPRLELIPQSFAMWDKADPRFVNQDGTGFVINKTLTSRLYNEYGISATINLFTLVSYPNRPPTASTSSVSPSLGFMMIPFTDKSGKSFCPTQADFNSADAPLFTIMKDYMDDTEGLYIAEKEVEMILENGAYRPIYATMLITETKIKAYGFYIENGLKIKADQSAMNSKTIYFYWPISPTMDPLIQGNRKLFTIRTFNTINGNIPAGQPVNQVTTDKRLGCVPKSSN